MVMGPLYSSLPARDCTSLVVHRRAPDVQKDLHLKALTAMEAEWSNVCNVIMRVLLQSFWRWLEISVPVGPEATWAGMTRFL